MARVLGVAFGLIGLFVWLLLVPSFDGPLGWIVRTETDLRIVVALGLALTGLCALYGAVLGARLSSKRELPQWRTYAGAIVLLVTAWVVPAYMGRWMLHAAPYAREEAFIATYVVDLFSATAFITTAAVARAASRASPFTLVGLADRRSVVRTAVTLATLPVALVSPDHPFTLATLHRHVQSWVPVIAVVVLSVVVVLDVTAVRAAHHAATTEARVGYRVGPPMDVVGGPVSRLRRHLTLSIGCLAVAVAIIVEHLAVHRL